MLRDLVGDACLNCDAPKSVEFPSIPSVRFREHESIEEVLFSLFPLVLPTVVKAHADGAGIEVAFVPSSAAAPRAGPEVSAFRSSPADFRSAAASSRLRTPLPR